MKLSLSFIFGWIFIPTTRKMFKVDWSGCKASSCCCRSCCSVVSCSCCCWWECWCSSEECGGGEHDDFFFVALGFQNEGSDWLLQLWNCFQINAIDDDDEMILWRMIFFDRTADLRSIRLSGFFFPFLFSNIPFKAKNHSPIKHKSYTIYRNQSTSSATSTHHLYICYPAAFNFCWLLVSPLFIILTYIT